MYCIAHHFPAHMCCQRKGEGAGEGESATTAANSNREKSCLDGHLPREPGSACMLAPASMSRQQCLKHTFTCTLFRK